MTERRSDEELEAERRYPAIASSSLSYPGEALREFARSGFIEGARWAAGVADTVPDRDTLYEAIYRALPKVSFSSAHDAQLATVAVLALLKGGETTDGN